MVDFDVLLRRPPPIRVDDMELNNLASDYPTRTASLNDGNGLSNSNRAPLQPLRDSLFTTRQKQRTVPSETIVQPPVTMYRLNNVQRVAIWNEDSTYPRAFEAASAADVVYYGMKVVNFTIPANPTQEDIDEVILRIRAYDDERTTDDDRIAVSGAVYHNTCPKVLAALLKFNYFPAAWTQMECVAEPSTANMTDLIRAATYMVDIVEWDRRMTGDSWTDDLWYPPQNVTSTPSNPYAPTLNNGEFLDNMMPTVETSAMRAHSIKIRNGLKTAPLRSQSFLSWESQNARSEHGGAVVTRESLAAAAANMTDNSTTVISSAELVYQDLLKTFDVEPQWTIPVTMAAGEVLQKLLQSAGTTDTETIRSAITRFTTSSFIGPIAFSIWGQNNMKDVILLQLDETKELQIIYPLSSATAAYAFPAPVFRDRTYTYNYLHTGAEITLGAICAVLTIISIVLGIILVIYQDLKPLAAASPLFLGAILIGSIFMYTAYWTWLPQAGFSAASCHLRYWFLGLGFVFLFGSLFAKSWRIAGLFDPSERNILKVTNQQLALAVGSFVIIEVILLTIWSATARPKIVVVVSDPLRPRLDKRMCEFGAGNVPMLILIVIYNLGLLMYGIYTTIKIWDVPLKMYNESREIAFSMYNLLCFSVLAFALQASGTVPDPAMFIIRSTAFMSCTFLAVVALFGPKLLIIIRYGGNGRYPVQEPMNDKKPAIKNENFFDDPNDVNSPILHNSPSSPRDGSKHSGTTSVTGTNGSNGIGGERNSNPKTAERNSNPKTGEKNSNPKTAERNSNPKTGEKNSNPKSSEKNSNPKTGTSSSNPRPARRSPTHHARDSSSEQRPAGEPRPYEYRLRHSSSSGTIAEENTGDFGFSRYSDDEDYFTDEDRRQHQSSSSGVRSGTGGSSRGGQLDSHGSFPDEDTDPRAAARGDRRLGKFNEADDVNNDDDDDDSFDFRKRGGGKDLHSSGEHRQFVPLQMSSGSAIAVPMMSSSPGKQDSSDEEADTPDDASDSSDDSYPPPEFSMNTSHHAFQVPRLATNMRNAVPVAPLNDYSTTTESQHDSARNTGRLPNNNGSATGRSRANTPIAIFAAEGGAGEGEDTPRNQKMRRFTVSGRASGSESYSPRTRRGSRDATQSARKAHAADRAYGEDDDEFAEAIEMKPMGGLDAESSTTSTSASGAGGKHSPNNDYINKSSAPSSSIMPASSVHPNGKSGEATGSADTPLAVSPTKERRKKKKKTPSAGDAATGTSKTSPKPKKKKKKVTERKRSSSTAGTNAEADALAAAGVSATTTPTSTKKNSTRTSDKKRDRPKHAHGDRARSAGKEDSDEAIDA